MTDQPVAMTGSDVCTPRTELETIGCAWLCVEWTAGGKTTSFGKEIVMPVWLFWLLVVGVIVGLGWLFSDAGPFGDDDDD